MRAEASPRASSQVGTVELGPFSKHPIEAEVSSQ